MWGTLSQPAASTGQAPDTSFAVLVWEWWLVLSGVRSVLLGLPNLGGEEK